MLHQWAVFPSYVFYQVTSNLLSFWKQDELEFCFSEESSKLPLSFSSVVEHLTTVIWVEILNPVQRISSCHRELTLSLLLTPRKQAHDTNSGKQDCEFWGISLISRSVCGTKDFCYSKQKLGFIFYISDLFPETKLFLVPWCCWTVLSTMEWIRKGKRKCVRTRKYQSKGEEGGGEEESKGCSKLL